MCLILNLAYCGYRDDRGRIEDDNDNLDNCGPEIMSVLVMILTE